MSGDHSGAWQRKRHCASRGEGDGRRAPWRQTWRFTFANEPAVDAGGVAREFWSLVGAALFDPNLGLFRFAANDTLTYQINPHAAALHPDGAADRLFFMAGRLLAKARSHDLACVAHQDRVASQRRGTVPRGSPRQGMEFATAERAARRDLSLFPPSVTLRSGSRRRFFV